MGPKVSLTEQEMALFSSISPEKPISYDSVGKPTNINQVDRHLSNSE
jgi:hypothetical protein